MRYTSLQRGKYEPIITIGEYVQATAPEVFAKIQAITAWAIQKAVQIELAAAYVPYEYAHYARIMTERPKPGRGGLLPGEGEEVLYD